VITTEVQIEDTLPPPTPDLKNLEKITMDWSKDSEPSSPTNNTLSVSHDSPPNETFKRPFSESSSSKPPFSPNNLNTSINEKMIKKPKIQSRSNSSNSIDTNSDEKLKPIIEHFTINESLPITYIQFKYVLDNFNNKAMNIHTLIENANTSTSTLTDIVDQIHPKIKDRSIKTRLTKLGNLLFQSQPPQQSSTQN